MSKIILRFINLELDNMVALVRDEDAMGRRHMEYNSLKVRWGKT